MSIKLDELMALSEKQQKKLFESIKVRRSIGKNGVYASQYGAYPPRLALTCGISLEKAKEMFDAYWKINWGIKAAAKDQKVKELDDGSVWIFNPVSKFWLSLRKDNDRFATLVSSTASFLFDLWLAEILSNRPQATGQFHDELIITVKTGYRKEIEEYIQNALKKVNESLKLNTKLTCGVQFGDRYSLIH